MRRVIDLHHGFTPANLALAAPVLASSVALLTVLRFLRELRGVLFAPAILVIVAVTYGFLVGALRNGLVPATYAYLSWLSPALVGLHVALHWRRYPEMRDAFLRTLAWGMAPAARRNRTRWPGCTNGSAFVTSEPPARLGFRRITSTSPKFCPIFSAKVAPSQHPDMPSEAGPAWESTDLDRCLPT